jgi:hypothetical protein
MKKTIKLIALAAIIGLTMTACPNEEEDTTDPTQLRLSNLPVTFEDETPAADFGHTWGSFSPSVIRLSNYITGTPKAQITGTGTDRKLTIELDQPKNEALEPIDEWLAGGVTATPNDAKIFPLDYWFNTSIGDFFVGLNKPNSDCYLIYVDRAVTINGGTGPFLYSNVSLDKGWYFLYGPVISGVCTLTASKTPPVGYIWTVSASN